MSELAGAQALVTGGGDGIGAALVDALAASGARVIAADLRFAAAEDTRRAVERVTLDMRDRAGLAMLVARAGAIDLLINNAGIGYYATIEEADPAAVAELLAVNVQGTLNAAQAVLPGMRARGRGTIVFISSIAGRITRPEGGFYSASKWAIEALAETLHWEVARFGIRVKLIEPGSIATGFVDRARAGRPRNPASPYGPLLADSDAVLGRLFTRDQSPALVARAVCAALARDVAFERVPVGIDAERELAALDGGSRADYLERLRRLYGFAGTT
jgi:NAD(P)-dependent dehydrogenase (short-subunit alcohol dehydrogenase family)